MAETFRQQRTRCGKPGCRSCPHGPYWYAFWKCNGKTKSRYIGKIDPRQEAAANPWDGIFSRQTASMGLACEILALSAIASREDSIRAFRRACMSRHPDRGGSNREMAQTNAAWDLYRERRGWN